MGLNSSVRAALRRIQSKHATEFGKVIQKILALSLIDMGYRLVEERTVQGVDIDIVHGETGSKKAIEVKTCLHREVSIAPKDIDGLHRRIDDGYEAYVAVLSLPLSVSLGWVMVPAEDLKPGRYGVLSLHSRCDEHLSEAVNSAFERRFQVVADEILTCETGSVLRFLKESFGI